ncbi:anti-sigma factor [Acidicapsa ligni]|uniref:anti-sigma factor n=1 Tax=Acidicapsa ligni TaxID=542300 RepID=UPI0021DF9B15|nr:anti-sigma factor [Acidicapsa ligni]
MSMQDAVHIPEDDLIQYALGTLPEVQLGNLTAHISLCNQCRDELARIQVELASYATVIPQEAVPAGARERFLKKLNTDTTESKFTQMRNNNRMFIATKSLHEWLQTPMPLRILSGALAAALLFVAYDDVTHMRQIRQLMPAMARAESQNSELAELKEFLHGNGAQHVSLSPKPVAQKMPEGHVLYAAVSGKLVFTAANLLPIPAGKTYELWLIPANGTPPIPAGLFKPDLQGDAAVIFPSLPTQMQASAFGVTIENEGGATTPTAPIVLSGQ